MQQDNRPGSGSVRARSSIDWRLESWRTPAVILICGCLISMIGFGPRATLGFFLTPMSPDQGWGREVFALSVAIQTLLYGAAQPFSGAIADRFGTVRVIIAGTLLYAAGIFMMAHASTPETLFLSSGVLIGFGLSGCSFNLVISSFGKLLPESWRSLAFGAGTASGSFGQFLFSPLAVGLIDTVGWRTTLEVFAGLLLLIVPLAFAIATPRSDAAPASPRGLRQPESETAPSVEQIQTYKQALAEALGHRSYILLVLGFFTCGFQLGFVTVASAVVPDRPRPLGPGRRLDAGRDRAVQHRGRDDCRAGSAAACPSATSWPSSISPARWRWCSSSPCPRARPWP